MVSRFGGSRVRTIAAGALAIALLSAGTAGAGGLQASCDLAITGKSGLGPWTSRVPTLRIRPVPSAAAGRWNAVLSIPVKSLEDGNKVRDTEMHDMFESKRWPEIRAELKDASPEDAAKSQRLAVALTIRDQTKTVDAQLSNWKSAGGHIEFDADVTVSLEAFALEAPSVLGLSRVDDEVQIHAHVAVDPAPDAK